MTQNLIKAIKAADEAAAAQGEEVIMTSARGGDFAERWFIVQGTRRAFRRTYVVDMSGDIPHVTEVLGGHAMSDDDLIAAARTTLYVPGA